MQSQMPSSPSEQKRPPVAKRTTSVSLLKKQSSSKSLYTTEEKAANHDAMLQRFQLRKMSSGFNYTGTFGRAKDVVIDKAIGVKAPLRRRFSFHRSVRTFTGAKARQQVVKALVSTISPKSWTSTVHGISILAMYHFQLIYLPFAPSYYPRGSLGTTVVSILLETFFLIDLLLNFNTAYVDKGFLVTSRVKIAQNYLRSWFAFDLLSAIPIQAVQSFTSGDFSCTPVSIQCVQLTLIGLRLLRITFLDKRVLLSRVMRVGRHVAEWLRYSRYSHLLGIAQLMWLVLLIAHYMACLWHIVSEDHNPLGGSVGEKYVADYYYAVSLIQGQGNTVGPWDENLFSSVAIIVGSVILAIVFGNVAMLVSNFNANTTNYHRKMEDVYATMDKMDLPLKLRERVNDYYTHVWQEYESLDGDVNKFQKELTHTLGIEIGLYKHMNLVVQISFWEDCTPDFLTQIVLNLGVRVYMPDDYVVRRREIGSEMMMINRGYCKLSKPNKGTLGAVNCDEEGHSTVLLSQDLIDTNTTHADSEDDSDDLSSDEEDSQDAFGGGMFGTPINSRRVTGNMAQELVDVDPSDFTDIRRFRRAHPRRPSYPTGTGPKKPRKYREYLYPGQGFGEMSLLMNYKRTANIRAITFVEMCILDRKSFQEIISRYPEDRRRVLTKMLESCIEKNVIPFPWENIIEAVTAKRRSNGNKHISRANVIATMTAAEAARILVEAIDVNSPDETIKYGFQSFDQGFIEDSSLRQAQSADSTISNTLQRRHSVANDITRRSSRTEGSESTALTGDMIDTESNPPSSSFGGNSDKTVNNLFVLIRSMASSIERLQQDVSELKQRDQSHCRGCRCHGSSRTSSANLEYAAKYFSTHRTDSQTTPTKEDQQAQISRKASLVAIPYEPSPSNDTNRAKGSGKQLSPLRKIRSNIQDSRHIETNAAGHSTSPRREHTLSAQAKLPEQEYSAARVDSPPTPGRESSTERYPENLSARSKAGRTQTLADALWKRSNTSGDMLKHTEEERYAARLRRHFRTRHSLPSDVSVDEMGSEAGNGIDKKPSSFSRQHHAHLIRHVSAHASLESSPPE